MELIYKHTLSHSGEMSNTLTHTHLSQEKKKQKTTERHLPAGGRLEVLLFLWIY